MWEELVSGARADERQVLRRYGENRKALKRSCYSPAQVSNKSFILQFECETPFGSVFPVDYVPKISGELGSFGAAGSLVHST